uniref:Ribosome biogenesis protein NOP53 n=1 Tax=Varanus komodoensis TaxID=61221 RepID=A0A8D2LAF1_VARKO
MAPAAGSGCAPARLTAGLVAAEAELPAPLSLSWLKMAEPAGEASLAAPEASSSFLGFGPNSREPGRLPSRRAGGKGARHRKKGWKRWRGPEVQLGRELGDWLEERAAELRHAGGLLSEKPDESLFFVDKVKGQNEKHAKEKPLRIDLILQPDSKVPPPKDILAHQIPNGRKQKQKQRLWEKLAEKGVMPRKERLLQERLQKAPALKADSEEASTALNPSRSFYDIWSDLNPLDKALAGKDSWFLEQTKKQPVKRPERLKKTPSQLPAVEVISPGGSYNPSFQSHQALLLQAHEIEVKRQKEAERLERQLRFPTAAEAPTQETVFREQCEGLLEDESDGEEGQDCPPRPPEVELQADAPTSHFPQAVAGEKKTERQRKKEKEAKQLKARERSAKAARLRRQELFQLRSIRLQVKRREAELQRRKQAREAKRKEEANAGAVQPWHSVPGLSA